jgi:hypothetical protein
MNPEQSRLQEARDGRKSWRKFGPYVAERQWGTVREDYSANGDAWNFTTHDQARSRAYRWGEEALAGFCDDQQTICFGLGLWNGEDAILKERLFGLSGTEGNHGEDVKEVYYYLDATPTHSYQRMLYKYPQHAFPYEWLVKENARRDRMKPEFELMDTAIFHENRYFDVFVEFAKADAEDILIQLTIVNRGPDDTRLHLLPQLWFRNTWAWGNDPYRPALCATAEGHIQAEHQNLSPLTLYCDEAQPGQKPALLFCENATNNARLYHAPSDEQFFKDGINDYLVLGQADAVNPAQTGTKAAAHYELALAAGATRVVRLRLAAPGLATPFADFDQLLKLRQAEADLFYTELQAGLKDAERAASGVCRHAVVQAVLLLRCAAVAGRRPGPAAPAARAPRRPQQHRLEPPQQPAHHLDARYLGIPLVRGLGPGFSLPPAGPARPRICQRAAHAAVPRLVHAPQRPAARLRVEAERREPARARLRYLARV